MVIGDIWDIIIIVLLIFILAYEINLQLVPNEDVRGEELWCGGAKDLNSPHHGSHYPCCSRHHIIQGFVSTSGALVVIIHHIF